MSQEKKECCQFCHAYLFDEDDVVICPECGAPYHRECFDQVGHCALEDTHGTADSYDVKKKKAEETAEETPAEPEKKTALCVRCGREIDDKAAFCPYCGAAKSGNASPFQQTATPFGTMPFVNADPCGGIPKEKEIEPGVTAADMANYIGPRSGRYVPRFFEERKTRWNGAAFVMPTAWFGYRKVYSLMLLTFLVFLAALVCFVPMYLELAGALSRIPAGTELDPATVMQLTPLLSGKAIGLSYLGMAILLIQAVLCGLFGENAYRTKVLTAIPKIKQADGVDDIPRTLAMKGGVNIWLLFLCFFLIYDGSAIISLIASFF